jgi:hypothetical protein
LVLPAQDVQVGRLQSKAKPSRNARPYLKNKARGVGGMVQVVEGLGTLSLNPSTTKKEERKERGRLHL